MANNENNTRTGTPVYPIPSSPPMLRTLQWNCRAIRPGLDYLIEHLAQNPVEVVALQSLTTTKIDLPALPGFHYPPYTTRDRDAGVRVATYVALGLHTSRKNLPVQLPPGVHAVASAITTSEGQTIDILNCYSPCPTPHFTWLADIPQGWIVLGDFNRRDASWEDGFPTTSEVIGRQLQEADMVLLNDGNPTRLPTRPGDRPSALDLTFVSSNLAAATDWRVLGDPMSSDHLPILITVHLTPVFYRPARPPAFNLDKADWEAYQQHLNSVPELDFSQSVDQLNEDVTAQILQAAKMAIPFWKPGRYPGNPWWNQACKTAVAAKRVACRRYLRLKRQRMVTVDDAQAAFKAMQAAKVACNRTVAAAKRSYWEEAAHKHQHDLPTLWNQVKILKGRYNPPEQDFIDSNGQKLATPLDKANTFLQHFGNASTTACLPQEEQQARRAQESTMDLSPPDGQSCMFSPAELSRALLCLRSTKKAPGKDLIIAPLLKRLPPTFKTTLLKLFNKCWEEGVVPQAWKDAVVVPIPKAGKSRTTASGYRPISLTSHVGKLYERLVQGRLIHYVEEHGLLPKSQAGFRRGRCTTDHLVKLGEHMRRAHARRRAMLSCFFDISKAFDTMWHAKLLHRLKTAGIPPNIYRFLQAFLDGRTIAVRWNGVVSNRRSIDTGVPQGSVISPLLFTLMLADVGKRLRKDTQITVYADDIAIWRTTRMRRLRKNGTLQKAEHRRFQDEVDKVVSFLQQSGFLLAPDKTVFLPFMRAGARVIPQGYSIKVNGIQVEASTSARYLGVTFQSNGCWNDHIKNAVNSGRKALNIIRAVRRQSWGQNRTSLVHLSLSLVRPRLLYGSQAFHSLPSTHLQKLAAVECTALRLALGLPQSTPQRKVYNEAGVLPLWHRIKRDAGRYLITAARYPNSTDEELDPTWNRAPKDCKYHGIVTEVSDLYHQAGVRTEDRTLPPTQPSVPPPPWARAPPDVRTHLGDLQKSDDPNYLAGLAKQLLAEQYNQVWPIYTDGSVLDDGSTGVGVFFGATGETISAKISNSTILTAELFAILLALRVVSAADQPPPTITIFTDSRSALHVLQAEYSLSRPELLATIQDLITKIEDSGSRVQFQWIPSHVGIRGNELADRAARTGAGTQGAPDITLRPAISDILNKLSKAAWDLWDREYQAFAITNNWSVTRCQRNSIETHFATQPAVIGNLISRIRVNHWRSRFMPAKCVCSSNITLQHCLLECQAMSAHFRPLREQICGSGDRLRRLQKTNEDGKGNWDLLKLAAVLVHTSPVGPYI